jgi:FkbM family methyltransferase
MPKFHGQWLQDKSIYERYFPNTFNGISIECGSFDGVAESSTLFFEESMNWTCINIEASPPIFELLKQNRLKAFNFNVGLANKDDVLTFKHVVHPHHGFKFGNGSFSHKPAHVQELEEAGCAYKEYEVKTTTYAKLIDPLMDAFMPGRSIDLFVLDVEGYEMEALEGMRSTKYLPRVLCIEYPIVGLENIKAALDGLDYTYDTVENNNAFFVRS